MNSVLHGLIVFLRKVHVVLSLLEGGGEGREWEEEGGRGSAVNAGGGNGVKL